MPDYFGGAGRCPLPLVKLYPMLLSRRRFTTAAIAGLAGSLASRMRAFPPRPKLLICLIAEQFRQAYLDRNRAFLVPGGFRRLMEHGAYFPDCRMPASGFTASGLATLATGTYPQVHGIVADRWFDRKSRAPVSAGADMLEAGTLAGELERAGHCRIYCVGLKEMPTSLLAGNSKALVCWMDSDGRFTTRGNLPEWLAGVNRLNPADRLHDAKWMAVGAGPDALPLRNLTYDKTKPGEFLTLYQASPFGQEAQFDLLRQLIVNERLGQQGTSDVVFLALGSMELLGYETGSDSPLMDQMTLRLDRQIRTLIEMLDKSPWEGNYDLVFAAAHGAPREPDAARRSTKAIPGRDLALGIDRALQDWFDKGTVKNSYVDRYLYPFLYLRPDTLRKQNVAPRAARRVAGEVALRLPGVAGYFTEDGDCSHSGEWRQRFANSFHALRSGDVMLSYEPGDVEDFGAGRGVSYGSLYNYDTHVPLMLYGAQFRPEVFERPVESVDLAPTLARAAMVSAPSSSTGRVLAEAFAEERR